MFNWATVFSFTIDTAAPECSVKLSMSDKWDLVQVTPTVLCVILSAAYLVGAVPPLMRWLSSREYRQSGKLAPTLSRLMDLGVGSSLTVLYYSYFVVVRSSLEMFNCVQDASGRSFLDSHPDVDCDSPARMALVPRASFSLVFYGGGIPVLFMFVLWRHRVSMKRDVQLFARGRGNSEADNPDYWIRRRYSRLYIDYEPRFFFWRLVLLVRKFWLVVVAIMYRYRA